MELVISGNTAVVNHGWKEPRFMKNVLGFLGFCVLTYEDPTQKMRGSCYNIQWLRVKLNVRAFNSEDVQKIIMFLCLMKFGQGQNVLLLYGNLDEDGNVCGNGDGDRFGQDGNGWRRL